MSWAHELEAKTCTPEAAVALLRSGWRVLVGSGCAEPQSLVRALVNARHALRDVEVVHLLTLGIADYVEEGLHDHFRHNAFFIGPNVRAAVSEGRADYTPIFLSEIPELIRSGQRRVDAVLLQLSPPDRHGYCSMGHHVDIQQAALQSARVVLAEINPNVPRTFGDTNVHLSRIHAIVHTSTPLLELAAPRTIDAVSLEIGSHVARLIDDGSCLQLGIGNIPNAVLALLGDKRHLGIHSEMFSDGVLPLLRDGNVDNSRKRLHQGKTVTSFCMGSSALYDYIDDNPSVSFYASDYVNDPRIISQNDQVVAVNSALQVDLTGQVCADSLGYRFYSGIGGQVDFIRGAAMSRGGKPIIALPSTAKGGTVSRIVATLDEGAGVVTSRGDVHYVVTEWGVAYLHGRTIRERALALVDVAHPDFRAELLRVIQQRHYVHRAEADWDAVVHPYPATWQRRQRFGDATLSVRPVRSTDERALQEFFYSHSEATLYGRYLHLKRELGHEEAARLCRVDYRNRMAFGVFEGEGPAERFVAIGRYDLNARTNVADLAIVVSESWRRVGIAAALIERLGAYAKERGVSGLRAKFPASNVGMRSLHQKLGHELHYEPSDSTWVVVLPLVDAEPVA